MIDIKALKRRCTALWKIATGRPVVYGVSVVRGEFSGNTPYIADSSMSYTSIGPLRAVIGRHLARDEVISVLNRQDKDSFFYVEYDTPPTDKLK